MLLVRSRCSAPPSHMSAISSCIFLLYPTGSCWFQRRNFIEHNSDPARWRSPQKAEVKRRHPGVKLGSEFAQIREQAMTEEQLVQADKFTDWSMASRFAIGAALVLVFLNLLLDTVEPNPPPEYTPYITPYLTKEKNGN